LRVARGLTQQQLAEATGLRRDTISSLERGKSKAIEFDTLARLCDALMVQVGDILISASSSHVAPVLGGEDEDAIIEDRLAEAEAEIDAIIADPSHTAHILIDEWELDTPDLDRPSAHQPYQSNGSGAQSGGRGAHVVPTERGRLVATPGAQVVTEKPHR
jgi:putative transcriptional regulator